jgi:hypothetical protein
VSSSSEERQKTLNRLEAERRGRALGLVGPAAAACGEWLAWVFETPGLLEALKAPRHGRGFGADSVVNISPGRGERPACTTSYSRVAPPSEPPDWDAAEWHRVWVSVVNPTGDNPGAIEEAQYAVAGDEVVIADLDGKMIGGQRLKPGEDPVAIARRLLRARAPKRSNVLVFPNMGVA